MAYFIATYIKNTNRTKISFNPIFALILVVASWAVVFDGATAWTVNHMDAVPPWLNMLLHALFFICMNGVTILIFIFLIDQTIGIRNKKMLMLYLIPGIVTILSVILTMKSIYYVEGKSTNYSMGAPVIICYVSLVVHFAFIFALLIIKRRTLEKSKMFSITFFMTIALIILGIQVIFPEVLLSSILPTITIVGIYMNFENPALRRLQQYNEDMITGFATLVENRDDSTGGHIRRTRGYVNIMLHEMRKQAKYKKILTKDYTKNVVDAAPMHDIGKIATPDYILQKPGKLTEEEYKEMKKHAAIGGDIIKETFADLDEPEYQQIAYEVARFHHEKWNGRGYPDGLSGVEIPLHARIMAIADVFDAVSAKRCYRDAMPIDKCFKIIEEGAGIDFDPDLVAIFMGARDKVMKYYQEEK